MSWESLLALCGYAFVTSVTPGPSNFMLLASGANFGFARSLPQVLGITAGFKALLLGMGLGLGALLAAFPPLHVGLKVAGGGYLLYLAWRIATSRAMAGPDGAAAGAGAAGRPLTFLESAAFQWINPKAWVVAATAMAVHASPDAPVSSAVVISAAFALVNLPSVSAWAAFGLLLRGFLSDPVRLKCFNLAMGALLAATLWPLVA
ncbi:LysE family translocator [Arenibaculum pallidiluteum]|uniref:LysE family translocator n=1 Tax=Arenibaculum pallidiluteum TaxID=2812559 RepID=UPI001A9708AA|nr:LysE family translocator [Arenibaculum pallidiluteum]